MPVRSGAGTATYPTSSPTGCSGTAHLLPIWERASNELSLDLLRALVRVDAGEALLSLVDAALELVARPLVDEALNAVRAERNALEGVRGRRNRR